MELNLFPREADTTVYEGEGGGYYAWTGANFPVLAQAALGAGKLVLQPRGFALPHYADTYKIGYVTQGTCTVGIVLPDTAKEIVLIIKRGDAIPVTMGSISWWFNGGDSDLTIIFLGESSRSYSPGQFDYFFLAGAAGILGGFSTEFISKIYGFDEANSKKLAKSQTNLVILKLDAEIKMPNQSNCNTAKYVFNLESMIPNASLATAAVTADEFPSLDKIGLSANLVRAADDSVVDPSYSTDGSHRIMYVTKGGGRIQIVGVNGARVIDSAVEEGQVFVVPRFFVAALLSDARGMEFICVTTSPRPVVRQLGGEASAYKALSSAVLQAALNVSPDFVQLFKAQH